MSRDAILEKLDELFEAREVLIRSRKSTASIDIEMERLRRLLDEIDNKREVSNV